jgi:hypothetical protein
MIDWSTVGPGLITLFSKLAFDVKPVNFDARWQGRPQKYVGNSAKTDLLFRVRSIVGIGEDETRLVETNPDGTALGNVHEAQLGDRLVTLEVRVESYKNTDQLWAWSTIERIRARIRRRSSIADLLALNFSFVDVGPAIEVPTPRDDHEWSVVLAEFTFVTRFEDLQTTPAEWIQSMEVETQFEGEDGAQLPSPVLDRKSVV